SYCCKCMEKLASTNNNQLKTTLLLFLSAALMFAFSQGQQKPFPQHAAYSKGTIIPNHISQQLLDDSTFSFYKQWQQRYIKKSICSESYYVWSENAGKNHECVSEGQGYGMIIVALMSGEHDRGQQLFDGLFKYYQEHPSKRNVYLMSWAQSNSCTNFEASSATDGDIDIAFSLLLADAQWTSKGNVNYLKEANRIITAIKEQEINGSTFSVLQSNSIENDSKDFFDMRSSDFIPAEFRSFFNTTKDSVWNKVISANYRLFNHLQKTYSKEAGLVPDFIQHINTGPRPATKFYLESKFDGLYNYNASRVPWRIATDYIIHGDLRAKEFIEPINKWIIETTENNPDNISAGYTLAGDDLKTRNFEALSFISSFAVSAMVDAENQGWLNKLWDYIIHFKLAEFDYFDNTIKMLQLIILSHNYWEPSKN
ncbi:MAG: glycosyl hydrolase family 8, partial [Ferruginibacter sp.]